MNATETITRLYETALDQDFSWATCEQVLAELGRLPAGELRAAARAAGYERPGSRPQILDAIRRQVGERRQFHRSFQAPADFAW